jgi:hypothetical protein
MATVITTHTFLNIIMKYVGIRLSSCGHTECEVTEQVTNANRVAGCLNDTLRRNKCIRKEIKSRTYKAVVTPVTTYMAEKEPDAARTQRFTEQLRSKY